MPPVVIIGHFKYANAKLMGVGHDWLEENGDFSGFEDMTHAEAFHIVPDRGMGLFFLKQRKKPRLLCPGCSRRCVPMPRCLTAR